MWEVITKYYCIDWTAMVLNALSLYLLGKKRKIGFFLGVMANIAWIVFAVLAHSVATVVACSIFVALNAKGWWSWRKEQSPNQALDGAASNRLMPMSYEYEE
jgi:nicotinamide riboside transporter PnuC